MYLTQPGPAANPGRGRAPASPATSPRVALVLSTRNEGAFLLEWIAYHQVIGFTDIFIAANDCTDGSPALLRRLEALGEITYLRNIVPRRAAPNFTAYDRIAEDPDFITADWAMVLDADEFLNIHIGDGRVARLIERCEAAQADAMAINWRSFGDAGRAFWSGEATLPTFTRAAPARAHINCSYKTLFRNDATFLRLGAHRPREPAPAEQPVWIGASGATLPDFYWKDRKFRRPEPTDLAFDWAQVNHYATRTRDVCLAKVRRGSGTGHHNRFGEAYWIERNRNDEEERSILRHAPAVARRLAALRADPVVARLEAYTRWRTARRFAPLCEDRPAARARSRAMALDWLRQRLGRGPRKPVR